MSENVCHLEMDLPDGVKFEEALSRPNCSEGLSFSACKLLVDKKEFPIVFNFRNVNEVSIFRNAIFLLRQEALKLRCLPMIGLQFIGPVLRQVAKQENVNFLDLAGNFYFRQENVHIERVVDKNPFTRKMPLQNLFAPVASRISRVLLNSPGRLWNLSGLAAEASVSLGMTHKVMDRMLDHEITKRDRKKIILSAPARLLDSWAEFYPKYRRRRYTFFSLEKSLDAFLEKAIENTASRSFALSFCFGANLVTPFLRGLTKLQLYIKNEDDIKIWKQKFDLHEVSSGQNIEIYVPYDAGVFYGIQLYRTDGERAEIPVVSDIQLYLDTFDDPARGEELAQHLRDMRLKF
jgi:hypothetical protein